MGVPIGWLGAAGVAFAPFAVSARPPTVHVATTAALESAVADVRLEERGTASETIELAAGIYRLDRPLLLDERDSHLAIIAAPGAHVVLSGGRDLGRLDWQPTTGGIWRARVDGPAFALLWRDGRRLIRARYPNEDTTKVLGGTAADATSAARVARWHDPAGGVIHTLQAARWGGMDIAVLGKNADGTLRLAAPTGNNRTEYGPSKTDRYVENVFEELDGPDEWYWDQKAHWLFYKPADGKRPAATGFVASHLETILHIAGTRAPARDITISGIAFQDTEPTFLKTTEPLLRSDWTFYRGGAVLIENAEHVTLAGGRLTELGGNAVVVSGHARAVAVRDNEIAHVGASGIAFVGLPSAVRSPLFQYQQSQPLAAIDHTPGPKSDAYPADSSAVDNLIHDTGQIEKQSAGVEISTSARITVSHNSIYHVPRAGINIGDGTWGGHVIADNDVFDTVRETGDHGAFNAWGRDRYWDPDRTEMNRRVAIDPSLVTLDAHETNVLRHNRFSCEHGWDVDLDDGASNYLIEDNLLLVGGLKLREGFQRTVLNNIILNNSLHPHVWFADSRAVFEHNIVMTAYQPIQITDWGSHIDFNLFTAPAALAAARANGTDMHSLAGRPMFVAPDRGDYRVGPGSPALKIGFRNFAMDEFGVTSPRLRAVAAHPSFPEPVLSPLPGTSAPPQPFEGATVKTIDTLGEQSTAGLPSRAGVLVLAVTAGSPAAKAGLRPGDVILSIGQPESGGVAATPDVATLLVAALGRHWQGQTKIEISRNQARQSLDLVLP